MIIYNSITPVHRLTVNPSLQKDRAGFGVASYRGPKRWLAHLVLVLVVFGLSTQLARADMDVPVLPNSAPAGSSVAVGDLNGDGFLDIVQGNDGQSYVYLNDGQGRLPATGALLGTPKSTASVAVGDLNGDGFLDIAQGNDLQSYIYLNDGQGHFPITGVPLGIEQHTTSMALGDLNGDGLLDIIQGNGIYNLMTKNYDPAQSYIYLNDGRGHFPIVGVPLGDSQPTANIAVGDLNGDGLLDIIQGNDGQNYIYLNGGHGSFPATGVPFGIGRHPASVTVGDINGDGFLDIIQGNMGNFEEVSVNGENTTQGKEGENYVYLNDGKGNFPSHNYIKLKSSSDLDICHGSVAVGDLNGDAKLDITVGNRCSIQNEIYLNLGAGRFSDGIRFGDADVTQSVALGDLNGDGKLDIITDKEKEGLPLLVYLSDRDIHFPIGTSFGSQNFTNGVAVGDLNSDGKLDIIVGNGGGYDVEFQKPRPNLFYLNNGEGQFPTSITFGNPDNTRSVALGDLNGDGKLDLVIGNDGQPNLFYLNDGPEIFRHGNPFGNVGHTRSMALGDLNGDMALDIVIGNHGQSNLIYLNNGNKNFHPGTLFGEISNSTRGIAVGDLNGDGTLDIVAGNERKPIVYLNNGTGNFRSGLVNCTEPPSDISCLEGAKTVTSVALGDLNSDEALDIVVGNEHQANLIYLNDGRGHFRQGIPFGDPNNTYSVAVADFNSDGALDIVVGIGRSLSGIRSLPDLLYFNDGMGNFLTKGAPLDGIDFTRSMAVGDFNSDGRPDIVVGNWEDRGQPNRVYLNSMRFPTGLANNDPLLTIIRPGIADNANFFSSPEILANSTIPLTYTLFDQEGDRVGRVEASYSLDGGGRWRSALAAKETITQTQNLTTGRWIVGASLITRTIPPQAGAQLMASLFITTSATISQVEVWLAITHTNNADLSISLQSPQGTRATLVRTGQAKGQNFQVTRFSDIVTTTHIISGTAPYTGTYQSADNLVVFNSEKTNGLWTLVITNTGSSTGTLAAWGLRLKTPPATHVFTWDTFVSGFFGQSDNVVIRMVAYTQPPTTTMPLTGTYRYTNSVPGPYQWPYASATTFPFRVRGTQVQVYSNTITATAVVSNALVYRLPNPATRDARPMADSGGRPFLTDAHGYLQGRGEIKKDEHLVALLPITHTNQYTLYYTSATPSLTGLEMYTVTHSGVQPLVVAAQHPLLLFNLTVALEWDARNDQLYQDQLRAYLQRTSALLYNWTNGQAALGNITIYHDRQHWNNANIRILASNRLRPNSDQGGIISIPLTETVTITKNGALTTTTLAYHPGQVRMPVFWNRFGVADGGSLGEDWPRTLAHELGHYLLFLYDNYLGFDEHDAFVVVTKSACPGVMTDPYRTDNFVIATDWLKRPSEDKSGCENTASNRIAGRADWATIAAHYPLITPTMPYTGPNTLPLAVTHITFAESITPNVSTAFAVPIYSLLDQTGKPYAPSGQARVFLFAPHRLIDLGHPIGDQIKAWGASPGQRLCLFDPSSQDSGCKTLTSSDSELRLQQHQGWPPAITVRPVTSSTIQITVTGVITPFRLHAQIYPVNAISVTRQSTISLTSTASGYIGEFSQVPTDTREAYLHIWTGDQLTDDSLQIVTDFAIGGNPVDTIANAQPGCYSPLSGWICSGAPVLSSDGQAMLLGAELNLPPGEFYAIQTVTQLPPTPSWTTVVGQAYRLLTSAGIPTLTNASLSLSYLTGEIPPGEKLTIYFYDETGTSTTWRPLTTTLQSEVNSAVASITHPGLYVLLSSLEVPLAGLGWNLIGYPVQESRPVTVALQSINRHYKTVYGYNPIDSTDPWKIYDVDLPPLLNDLTELDFGQGYWVNITDTLGMTPTLQLKGTSPSTTTHQGPHATAVTFSLLRPPPATYWGELVPTADFTPTADITVTASIEGVECGTAGIQQIDGKLMYRIKVRAADPVNATESKCGVPGRMVTFTVGSQELAKLPWDNNHVVQVSKPDQ